MSEGLNRVDEQAIDWVVRLRDAGPETWAAFTDWLEADPAHAAAYDEVALADAEMERLAPPRRERLRTEAIPEPSTLRRSFPARAASGRTRPDRTSRRMVLGGAIAAAFVGLIGYGTLGPDGSRYEVATGAGERRSVELADGSRIDLNGSTQLTLDRDAPRFARLERGEALFTIVHDASHPFEVESGDAVLRDMGTIFNVIRDDAGLEVGVAEGAVLFNPEAEAVNLTPGMVLRAGRTGRPRVSRREPEAISGWRQGRLVYSSATVEQVASDLSRNLGRTVQASRDAGDRTFTGVIIIDSQPERTVGRAASLLGVEADRSGEGWILKTGAGETR